MNTILKLLASAALFLAVVIMLGLLAIASSCNHMMNSPWVP